MCSKLMCYFARIGMGSKRIVQDGESRVEAKYFDFTILYIIRLAASRQSFISLISTNLKPAKVSCFD